MWCIFHLKSTQFRKKIYCGVEQLVARRAHNPKVARSSRVPATPENPRFSRKKASILEAFFALVLQIGVTKIVIFEKRKQFFLNLVETGVFPCQNFKRYSWVHNHFHYVRVG